MIESIIKFIQDKGYMVDVRPQHLVIRKEAKGQLFSIAWWEDPQAMRQLRFSECMFDEATRRMRQLEDAIASYQVLE